jgi:hypothetical protein
MGRCYVDLRPETVETAEYISKTLGQSTVQFKTRSEGGKKGSPFFSNVNEALHFGSRPLLTQVYSRQTKRWQPGLPNLGRPWTKILKSEEGPLLTVKYGNLC